MAAPATQIAAGISESCEGFDFPSSRILVSHMDLNHKKGSFNYVTITAGYFWQQSLNTELQMPGGSAGIQLNKQEDEGDFLNCSISNLKRAKMQLRDSLRIVSL